MITTNYAGNAFSAAFQAAVAQPMVGYTAKLYYNGSALTCDIMRLDLTLGSCADPQGDSDFAVGEVYTSYLEGTLYNVSGSLVGKELDVCIGVDVGSGVYEYAQVATVVVTSAKTRAGVTAFQAAGKLAYEATNTPIGTSGELAPSAVASAIATATGLTVTIGAFASTSTTVTIESGMTCRAALGALAKRLGGYACETNTGGVAIVPFSSTSTYTLDPGTSTKLPDVEEADFAVDGITVQADEADYTSGTGRVVIEDASATATTEAVTWGNINGYAFRPGSANTAVLDPRITPFDVLAVTHEGSTVNLPARGIAATYDGGYFGTFSAVGLTDAGEDALMRGPLGEKVDLAQRAANEAMEVAEATNQHFWPYTDGVHVTGPETQDEFLAAEAASFPDYDPTTKPYHNILMNALGILLRTTVNNLVSITRSAIAFFDGEGNSASNIVASFGVDGAQIGKADSSHINLGADDMNIANEDGAVMFNVDMDAGAMYAYGGQNQEHQGSGEQIDVTAIGSYSEQVVYNVNLEGLSSGDKVIIPAGNTLAYNVARVNGYSWAAITIQSISSGLTYSSVGYSKDYNTTADIQFVYGTAIQDKVYTVTGTVKQTVAGVDGSFTTTVTFSYGGGSSFTITVSTSLAVSSVNADGFWFSVSAWRPEYKSYILTKGAALTFGTRQAGEDVGLLSSSFGEGLIASGDNQLALGQYNIADPNGDYALIIGIGTADNDRKNAFAVSKSGAIEYGVSGDHSFIFPNGNTNKPSITHWRLVMTSWGNLRLDSSTDGGTNWSTVRYFAGANSDKGVCSGVTSTINASANSVTTDSISFPSGYFSSAPNVVVGFYSTSTAAAFGGLTCAVKNITTTGADVVVFNNTSTGRSPQVEWIAFGTT